MCAEHALMHTKENNVDVPQCCACALVRALCILGCLQLSQQNGAHYACCYAQVGGVHSSSLTQASTPSLRLSATTMMSPDLMVQQPWQEPQKPPLAALSQAPLQPPPLPAQPPL